jgi:hypothetical protein
MLFGDDVVDLERGWSRGSLQVAVLASVTSTGPDSMNEVGVQPRLLRKVPQSASCLRLHYAQKIADMNIAV